MRLPPLLHDPAGELALEAYSPANQEELWHAIQTDRAHPKRAGIWPGVHTFAALRDYMLRCGLGASPEHGYAIRARGELVGTFHVTPAGPARAEIGYWVHHAFTHRGVATRALLLAERALPFSFLEIRCQSWNERSWAVAERAGYRLLRVFHEGRECAGCDDCTRVYEKALPGAYSSAGSASPSVPAPSSADAILSQ